LSKYSKLGEEKQFRVSAIQGISSIFGYVQGKGIFRGEGACNAVCDDDAGTIPADCLWHLLRHFLGQSITDPNTENNIFDGKGTPPYIAEAPEKSRVDNTILVGFVV
jgi:hypothetical protein